MATSTFSCMIHRITYSIEPAESEVPPVGQPSPSLELLQEEYLLVEAWKKTAAHLRAHNWFADSLAIDRAAVNLPRFLGEVADRLASPGEYETHPIRLVPAPKSHRWTLRIEEGERIWEPWRSTEEGELRIRPLAHVDLKDQVAATAVMLCLADRVETRQGDPTGPLTDPEHRRRVLSYGNRLLCDVEDVEGDAGDKRLLYRWGTSSLYRGYFEDYRTFIERPTIAAEAASNGDSRIVIVRSDLKSFYDRVRPAHLSEKLLELKQDGDSDEFFQLAASALTWAWDPEDESSVIAYGEQEEIAGFDEIALPQGLAAAGFFSNVVLLGVDDELRRWVSEEIFEGATLIDVARYVDDLTIVLRIDSTTRDLADIEQKAKGWLDDCLEPEKGLETSAKKTRASEFGLKSDRPIVRQGDRMMQIQRTVSGGFDIAGGEAVLEAIRGLMRSQQWHPDQPPEAEGWPLTPVADVPNATVARFGAARFRRVYRWLRPLFDEVTALVDDSADVGGHGFQAAMGFPSRTRAELDNDAQVFAADLIRTWIGDPSNIRLLRVAFDIWPAASALEEVLQLLMPYVKEGEDGNAQRIAQYCLGELFRAGATETGIVEDDEVLQLDVDEYRMVLQRAAQEVIEYADSELPWYLRQQALLFLATRGAVLQHGNSEHPELQPYAALVEFLADPSSSCSSDDFATFSVLARRCFAPGNAVALLAPHFDTPRLTRVAEADPDFALELLKHDKDLVGLLPERIARDLCKSGAVPTDRGSLARLVLGGKNPFRDELSLLQFAKEAIKILRRGQRGLVTPVDLEVTFPIDGKWPNDDKWQIRSGGFGLRLHRRRYLDSSIYSPPHWCPEDERWRFQLGYLLRFILTERENFTAPVRSPSWREKRGDSYRPVREPWQMKRYAFFNAHQAFGDPWLPATEWTTQLLIRLLAWPGARHPDESLLGEGLEETAKAIQDRIDEILKSQGPAKSELLLKLAPAPPLPIEGQRPLRAAVVQTVLPRKQWFQEGPLDLTTKQRKLMRSHVTSALAAVRSSLRLRSTHQEAGDGLDLLILPELSVHIDDLYILKQFAISEKTIILAGVVYHPARRDAGQSFVNSAVWLIPERIRDRGRQVRIIEQGKWHLTKEEEQLAVEPFRPCQWLIGYPWATAPAPEKLWLTASVCYDATDFALAADLRGHSDVYIIPALNQDTTTFDQMALALHYHMFQMVILANNGLFGGSNAYVPYKDRHKRRVFHFHGQPQAAIAFVGIDDVATFLRRTQDGEAYKTPPAGIS